MTSYYSWTFEINNAQWDTIHSLEELECKYIRVDKPEDDLLKGFITLFDKKNIEEVDAILNGRAENISPFVEGNCDYKFHENSLFEISRSDDVEINHRIDLNYVNHESMAQNKDVMMERNDRLSNSFVQKTDYFCEIKPGKFDSIKTNISFDIPEGYSAEVKSFFPSYARIRYYGKVDNVVVQLKSHESETLYINPGQPVIRIRLFKEADIRVEVFECRIDASSSLKTKRMTDAE